jgi:hypothetical protein
MHEVGHCCRRDALFSQQLAQALDDGDGWVTWSRQHFANRHLSTFFSQEENISKGPANIYAHTAMLFLHGGHYTKEAGCCQLA